jgi:uncharacterized membrane protein YsdA (DUF1294 family)
MSRIYEKQKRLRDGAFVLVAVMTVLLQVGLSVWAKPTLWSWFTCYFTSINAVTWMVFFYDKRVAGRKGVIRVPESALFLLAVGGGLPSTLLAMQVLRHKRAKASFKRKLFMWFGVVYGTLGGLYWYWPAS